MNNPINIFYSWQSDLPDNTNKIVIRDMLQKAKNIIETEKKINIIIDEAIRNKAGSPNISLTILEKIDNADMFVSDITTINKTDTDDNRKTPNPNVMYELGYAVAKLGWEKIILILNEEYGTIDEIPFDIRQHAITSYSLSDSQTEKQRSIIGNKAKEFENKINLILDIKPKAKIFDNQIIIKQRDIKIIEKIMKQVPYTLIREQIRYAPRQILVDLPVFFEDFERVLHENIEYLHDNELNKLFRNLYHVWQDILSNSLNYHSNNPDSRFATFVSPPGDMPLDKSQQKLWDYIENRHKDIDNVLKSILDIIKDKYIEIDLKSLNDTLLESYQKIKLEIEEQFKDY